MEVVNDKNCSWIKDLNLRGNIKTLIKNVGIYEIIDHNNFIK